MNRFAGEVKKIGAWSEAELHDLARVVKALGGASAGWGIIASHIQGRCGYQCRSAYYGKIAPEETPVRRKSAKQKNRPGQPTPATVTPPPPQLPTSPENQAIPVSTGHQDKKKKKKKKRKRMQSNQAHQTTSMAAESQEGRQCMYHSVAARCPPHMRVLASHMRILAAARPAGFSGWCKAKKKSWLARETNPNAFYYRHLEAGEEKRTGPFDAAEIEVCPPGATGHKQNMTDILGSEECDCHVRRIGRGLGQDCDACSGQSGLHGRRDHHLP